jgi:hypothetical protein
MEPDLQRYLMINFKRSLYENVRTPTSYVLLKDHIKPVAKKIASAIGAENYNILQNNGRLAHQVVDHVRELVLYLTIV